PDVYRSLSVEVSALRWMALVTLFSLAARQPRIGRFGIINWELILIFAGYNLLAEFILDFEFGVLDYNPTPIHNLKPKIQNKLLWRVIIDLPAAGLVYFSSATPGAPQFDLIFLAVLCAAVSMPLRVSLVYTAAAVA